MWWKSFNFVPLISRRFTIFSRFFCKNNEFSKSTKRSKWVQLRKHIANLIFSRNRYFFAYKPSNFAPSISRHFTIFSGLFFFCKNNVLSKSTKTFKMSTTSKKIANLIIFSRNRNFWKPSYLSLNYACKVSLWWFIRIRNNVLCYASEIRVLQRLRDSKNKHCVQVCFSSAECFDSSAFKSKLPPKKNFKDLKTIIYM